MILPFIKCWTRVLIAGCVAKRWRLTLADLAFSWLGFLTTQKSFLFQNGCSTVVTRVNRGGRRNKDDTNPRSTLSKLWICKIWLYSPWNEGQIICCLLFFGLCCQHLLPKTDKFVFSVLQKFSQLVLNTTSRLNVVPVWSQTAFGHKLQGAWLMHAARHFLPLWRVCSDGQLAEAVGKYQNVNITSYEAFNDMQMRDNLLRISA